VDVKWVVENYERDGSLDPFIKEIGKQGMECQVVKYVPFQGGKYDLFPDDDCVVFFGSLNLAHQLQREKGWVPGAYCNFKNFECITYYSHWGKYLLNDDYIMLPLMDFYNRRKWMYNEFGGYSRTVFLRPNSGSKTFNGALYPEDELDGEMELIESYGGMPMDQILTVVSSPKVIEREWRIVVVDRKVVASSQYRRCGNIDYEEGCDEEARQLAHEIAQEPWQPDRAYVLDVSRSLNPRNGEREYRLLEANSFSCSGLYECEVGPIVSAVSSAAKDEWLEYQDV